MMHLRLRRNGFQGFGEQPANPGYSVTGLQSRASEILESFCLESLQCPGSIPISGIQLKCLAVALDGLFLVAELHVGLAKTVICVPGLRMIRCVLSKYLDSVARLAALQEPVAYRIHLGLGQDFRR